MAERDDLVLLASSSPGRARAKPRRTAGGSVALVVALLTAAASGCARTHDACVDDAGGPIDAGSDARPQPTETIPWPDVSVRFLGISNEDGGAAVRWAIRHDDSPERIWLGYEPIFSQSVALDVVTSTERGATEDRVTIWGAPPHRPGYLAHTVGLRLRKDDTFWEIPARGVEIDEGGAAVRYTPGSYDASVSIELAEAPSVPRRGGALVLEQGVEYTWTFRIHNWTDESREVRAHAFEPIDWVRTLEPSGASELTITMRPPVSADSLGMCIGCFSVSVLVDGVLRDAIYESLFLVASSER